MQTILGPFHPHLEDAFVEEILRFKSADPLCPLLTVVPSDALRRRLKILCARERRLSLVNLQFLTFHQLSLRLFADANGTHAPALHEDLFLEEALRQMIRTRQPGAAAFAGIEERAGGCAALWQTLRDLRDAKVDPRVALEALREGHFSEKTGERTSDLLLLLQTLLRFCQEQGIEDHSDLDKLATEQVPSSNFLGQFEQIFYYGFYDLTQIQVDMVHAVAQNFPTTLFFPLLQTRPSHQGWSFAERFYQSYVQGLSSTAATNLVDAAEPQLPAIFHIFDETSDRSPAAPPQQHWRCTILNAFGIQDEVTAAAKEILRLVAESGRRFHEIGVVARSLETYGATIKEIFDQHHIPLSGAVEEPLVQFPLTKAVILLLNLPAKDFLRTQVIDLLSSPYFRLDACGLKDIQPRPDLWDLATRELAICKGIHEWRRLRNYTSRDLVIAQISDDDEPRVVQIGSGQMRGLAELVDALAADLLSLPPNASWTYYAGAWQTLLEKYLGIASTDEAKETSNEPPLHQTIGGTLNQIAGLDAVHDKVSITDFSRTFQHWLERTALPIETKNADGVAVLSATAARGLSFHALFVLGLNEGVFPRTIREDAFLRDRDRTTLEDKLGYKVNQKLAAFDEEKLLFTLLASAARERLYCLFQRSDDSGRVLSASWYLDDLKRALGIYAKTHIDEITIPRSLTDKSNTAPFDREDLLLPEELAIRLSLESKDATSLIEACALTPNLYKQGRTVVEQLDQSTDRLHGFDGVVGPLAEHWKYFSQRGLSPTALETYARCPFQFFARHVLGLKQLETPEASMGPSAAEFGELGHEILKSCYQHLIDIGYFTSKSRTLDLADEVLASAQRIFAEYEAKHPIGYPLAWESLKEGLTQLIRQVVAQDLNELSVSGYVPIRLEKDQTEQLPADWPEPLNGLTIHGRMDRIDLNRAEHRLRVIDYKFKFGSSRSTQDKDLYRSAVRGERLQPPFYYLLGKRAALDGAIQNAEIEVEANFYYIAPRWSDGPLVTTGFGAAGLSGKAGAEIKHTIAYLAAGIQNGRFFIQRGEHCQHCDVAEICRKNHPPSLWRAENDPVTKAHRELHHKDPNKL